LRHLTFYFTLKSGAFLTKYLAEPLVTITSIQKVTVEDLPWITICPEPGYSFSRMKEYEGVLFPAGQWPSLTGVDLRLLGEASQANVSVDEFLRNVSLPVLTSNMEVWFVMSDGSWVQDNFSTSGKCSLVNRRRKERK
jgi:hypothetical protein